MSTGPISHMHHPTGAHVSDVLSPTYCFAAAKSGAWVEHVGGRRLIHNDDIQTHPQYSSYTLSPASSTCPLAHYEMQNWKGEVCVMSGPTDPDMSVHTCSSSGWCPSGACVKGAWGSWHVFMTVKATVGFSGVLIWYAMHSAGMDSFATRASTISKDSSRLRW